MTAPRAAQSTMSSQIRVLIASHHTLLRLGIRRALEHEQFLTVVGDAADFEETVRLTRRVEPDVAVLGFPSPPQRTLLGRMRMVRPACRVLVLAHDDDPAQARIAVDAGAAGYLGSDATEQELTAAVRKLYYGQEVLMARLPAATRATNPAPQPTRPLSRREEQVLALLARGHTNREAANELGVGIKTVETYRARLVEKLGLVNRADLVAYAIEAGVLVPL